MKKTQLPAFCLQLVFLFCCQTVFSQQKLPWPVEPTNEIHRIFAGYGTYDDFDKPGTAPHFHEGLDILEKAGTRVIACEAGTVVLADDTSGYTSFVMVSRGKNLNEALSYIHINVAKHPKKGRNWQEGDTVERGDLLGTVFNASTIKLAPHLHFDWRRKEKDEPWKFFMDPSQGKHQKEIAIEFLLPEFNGNPIELLTPVKDQDTNKPKFSKPVCYRNPSLQYFKNTLKSGDTVINSNVDIVANISETFGPAKTDPFNIGPKKIEWDIQEFKPGDKAKIETQVPANFSGRFLQEEPSMKYTLKRINVETVTPIIPKAAGTGRNLHWKFYQKISAGKNISEFGKLLEVQYSNEKLTKSLPRDPTGAKQGDYWYILTNIDTKNKDVESRDIPFYWDTNGKEGEEWNNNDDTKDHEATANKDAAFPDGRYILSIKAYGYGDDADIASRKDTVSVNNFNEYIFSCDKNGTKKDVFAANEPVYIKGEGFPISRSFKVYVIKDREWKDGDAIPNDANRVAAVTVTSDDKGLIQPVKTWDAYTPNGKPDKGYDIVLDYDWDLLYSIPRANKTIDVPDVDKVNDKTVPYSIIGGEIKTSKTSTNAACYGVCNGTAAISVTGGVPPYQYSWSDMGGYITDSVRNGLCAGTYLVNITDSVFTTITDTIIINQPSELTGIIQALNPSCGQCNGAIFLTAAGGTPPYVFSWPGGMLTGVCAGNYTGIVTDAAGCTDTVVVHLYDSVQLQASVAVTHATDSLCNGSAIITASGGMAPYTYSWPGGILAGLCPGTYTGTVTDATGCTDTVVAVITSTTAPLQITVSGTNSSCDSCNGTANVMASGGVAPYTYNWPNGMLTDLCPGTYIAVITDAIGNTVSDSVIITAMNIGKTGIVRLCDTLIKDTSITLALAGNKSTIGTNALQLTKLYPNPFTGKTNIEFYSTEDGIAQARLQSVQGNIVKSFTIPVHKGSNIYQLEGSWLKTGIYFLNISLHNTLSIKLQKTE